MSLCSVNTISVLYFCPPVIASHCEFTVPAQCDTPILRISFYVLFPTGGRFENPQTKKNYMYKYICVLLLSPSVCDINVLHGLKCLLEQYVLRLPLSTVCVSGHPRSSTLPSISMKQNVSLAWMVLELCSCTFEWTNLRIAASILASAFLCDFRFINNPHVTPLCCPPPSWVLLLFHSHRWIFQGP